MRKLLGAVFRLMLGTAIGASTGLVIGSAIWFFTIPCRQGRTKPSDRPPEVTLAKEREERIARFWCCGIASVIGGAFGFGVVAATKR